MRVVSILGGLGSQMIKYAFYLAIKDNDDCYIDTTPFRLENVWNGYELEVIFGIKDKDLSESISDEELARYKEQGDNYKSIAVKKIDSLSVNKKTVSFFRGYIYPEKKNKVLYFLSLIYNKIKHIYTRHEDVLDTYPKLAKTRIFNCYYDEFNHVSDKYIGGPLKKETLKSIFQFPPFKDERNLMCADRMINEESVAISIRRSDHMYDNERLYEDGYYQKSINFIKEKVVSPFFYLFSDEPEWCENNLKILGFSDTDKVTIIDWNRGSDSYRDMQLMTYCKHNIMAISIFSWWGFYLGKHSSKEKVSCAPRNYWLDATVHF